MPNAQKCMEGPTNTLEEFYLGLHQHYVQPSYGPTCVWLHDPCRSASPKNEEQDEAMDDVENANQEDNIQQIIDRAIKQALAKQHSGKDTQSQCIICKL